jgi:hypothetical protein
VASDPKGIDCTDECSAKFPVAGGVVTLTAADGTFTSWSLPCSSENDSKCDIEPDGDQSVTASFATPTPTPSAEPEAEGG